MGWWRLLLFITVLVFGLSLFASDGTDTTPEASPLPSKISGLVLGQPFDVSSESVHAFEDADGTASYVFHDSAKDRSINVELGEQGHIIRLSWHFLVHDEAGIQAAKEDLHARFGSHFVRKEATADGEVHFFEDESTQYAVSFEGHMVTVVTRIKDRTASEDE